jgi:oligogalacturonide transport system permease protein
MTIMNKSGKFFVYLFLCGLAIVMLYPMIWLFFASFKPNHEIFGSIKLLPETWIFDSYTEGWKGSGQFTFAVFLKNSFILVVPTVIFTVISSVAVAYGFARFNFPCKKFLFGLMISTLMLPNTVIIIPRYILFDKLHWVNSYLPFIIPSLFGCYPFFIYLMIQFFKGIPREIDEAAYMDGCNTFHTLTRIMIPLSVPAIISVIIFQFLWTWNDFFNVLIYVNSVSKFPVSLGLRMCLDSTSRVNWSAVLAMSIVCILPCTVLFFVTQRYFVEGIVTTGLKG